MTENPMDRLQTEIPTLRRFARALVRNPERADDLVQDTLERAITRLDSYMPGTNMRAWLFTILRNNYINELRRSRTTAMAPETIDSMMPPVGASQDQGLALRDLQRALQMLSPDMREVVLLVGLEGLSYDEAAEILGVKVGTVKSRLCRGREALRLLMDGVTPDETLNPSAIPAFEATVTALQAHRTSTPLAASEFAQMAAKWTTEARRKRA